ncbi:MAG: T9SS type A sorting domain-containing protein [Candidatus Cloacimonetes bacterium]|nr:T9SS type A sorting domain-containing protein [Candidatus Cloacimonadota bacterium]
MKGKFSNCTFRNASSTYTSTSVMGMPLISITGDKRLEFENCVFENLSVEDDDANVIQIGGIQFPQQQNHFSFTNCLFNKISSHDNMILVGSSNNPRMDFTNCTFADNQGDAYTLKVNGEVNIVNSIFDNDTPYQIKVNSMDGNPSEHTNISIDHSLIKGGVAGILPFPVPGNTIDFLPGSISGDPLFVRGFDIHDPLYYTLSEGSPCIDAGTRETTGLNLPPYDLAGNWRVWNDRIDMGCFEFDSRPWVSNDDPVLPEPVQLTLHQNYPNPFNPTTTISFDLAKPGPVTIDVFNIKGQKMQALVDNSFTAGQHSITWDGTDSKGKPVASGVYFYRMTTPKSTLIHKMLLMK